MKEYEDSVRQGLLKLHMQGFTTRQIAAKLGISASGVSRNLVKFRRIGALVEEPPPNKHSRRRTSIGPAVPDGPSGSTGTTSSASSSGDKSDDDDGVHADSAEPSPDPPRSGSAESAAASAAGASATTGSTKENATTDTTADTTEPVAAAAVSVIKHNPLRSARAKGVPTGDRSSSTQPEKADGTSKSTVEDAVTTNATSSGDAVGKELPTHHAPESSSTARKRLRSGGEAHALKQSSDKRAAVGKRKFDPNASANTSDSRNTAENDSGSESGAVASSVHSTGRARTGIEPSAVGSADRTSSGRDSQVGRGAAEKANVNGGASSAGRSVIHQGKKKWRKGELCWAGWLANSIASPAHPSSSDSSTAGAIQLMYRCRFRGQYHPNQIIGLSERQTSGTGVLEERDNTQRGQSVSDSDPVSASA